MTNVPLSGDLIQRVRAASLDVGVHLVITHGRPLSDPAKVRSLVAPGGTFLRPREIVGTGRVRADDVLREFRLQYARGHEILGHAPSHLDTHHWIEADPEVQNAFLELARETGAAVRCLTPAIRDRARAIGVRTPDGYSREFQHAGHIDVPALLRILGSLPDGTTELGCHPGEPDPELEGRSSYARERPTELAALTHPDVRRRLDELAIELTTFAVL
jgi:hypothetical protein